MESLAWAILAIVTVVVIVAYLNEIRKARAREMAIRRAVEKRLGEIRDQAAGALLRFPSLEAPPLFQRDEDQEGGH